MHAALLCWSELSYMWSEMVFCDITVYTPCLDQPLFKNVLYYTLHLLYTVCISGNSMRHIAIYVRAIRVFLWDNSIKHAPHIFNWLKGCKNMYVQLLYGGLTFKLGPPNKEITISMQHGVSYYISQNDRVASKSCTRVLP